MLEGKMCQLSKNMYLFMFVFFFLLKSTLIFGAVGESFDKEREIYSRLRRLESNIDYKEEKVKNRPVVLDFGKALEYLNKAANLIYQRFEFSHADRFQFFLESSNMPVYGWDLIKYKIAQKIVSFAEKYDGRSDVTSATISDSQQYLMIFGGSSVTAGHDNYYSESYPFVFERRLVDVFHHLGMKLLVHNIAQGSNNCRPSDYCYEAMGGDNPDFLSWEQSFNCGRSRDIPEYMARVASWSGGVAYYMASGAFTTSECKPTTDPIPWTSESWTPEAAGITKKYEITPEKATSYRTTLGAWYDDGNSVSRFTNQVFGGLYRSVGPHGYSVWGHSSKLCNNGTGCDALNVRGPCYDQGGPHWMVAETSYYAREKGKHGRSWHPPAGMHLMRGEVLAYNYAHILADTLFMVQEDLKHLSKTEALQKYQKAWEELRVPAIPEKALHLTAAEGHARAYCYTSFQPHFNPRYLLEAIVLKNSVWRLRTAHHDDYGAQSGKYGYQDTRPSFEGGPGGEEIYLRLDRVRSGEVRICGFNIKEALSKVEISLDPNYSFPVNVTTSEVTYHPTTKKIVITNHRNVGDECYLLPEIPQGDGHVLILKTTTQRAILSHVIIF